MIHDSEKLKDPVTETTYLKCKRCGKVWFEDEPLFNMVCQVKIFEREKLRQQLQK